MFVQSQDLKLNAECLLNRSLKHDDGISVQQMIFEEKRLGIALPNDLRRLYTAVGNVDLLMRSFVQILMPSQLQMEGNILVFAEEYQGVCDWGVDVRNETVYQRMDQMWMLEQANLAAFLSVILFYNCAQGGYPYNAVMPADEFSGKKQAILKGYRKVVDYNGLWIYFQCGRLIWGFSGESEEMAELVYLSTLTEEVYAQCCIEYGFSEL